jgi:hypothetical protein
MGLAREIMQNGIVYYKRFEGEGDERLISLIFLLGLRRRSCMMKGDMWELIEGIGIKVDKILKFRQ